MAVQLAALASSLPHGAAHQIIKLEQTTALALSRTHLLRVVVDKFPILEHDVFYSRRDDD